MPRDGAIIFGDLIGKLDVLEVACDKCGRNGRYAVARLIERIGCGLGIIGPGRCSERSWQDWRSMQPCFS
jgi:hypothetical protein